MILSINDLYKKIAAKKINDKTMLIGIDGAGGSGKSTFVEAIKNVDPDNVTIVHMDDFYKTSEQRKVLNGTIGELWDCDRVKTQVLMPLKNSQPAKYQIYDWDIDQLSDWYYIPTGGIVLVEGCYSLIENLNNYYDIKIWIDTPHELRIFRGIERDGEEKRHLWEDLWMPAEDYYIKAEKPVEIADLIIDGSGKKVSIHNSEINILKMGSYFGEK